MMVSKPGQVASKTYSRSSGRQLVSNLGSGPASKSKARNSASSSTTRGRKDTRTHCKIRWAHSLMLSWISCKVRSYVQSSVAGNSSREREIRRGGQARRISNWQATKLNLYCVYQRSSSCIPVLMPYIPSAFCGSVSMTMALSCTRHLRMPGSEPTMNVT
jgi:hypothetical protein